MSFIQLNIVPPNLQFLIDDFEQEWMSKALDYVHARTIAGYVSKLRHYTMNSNPCHSCVRDWPLLMSRAFEHLKPGGYLEVVEFAMWAWSEDGSLEADSPFLT